MKYTRFIYNFILDTLFAERKLNKVEVVKEFDEKRDETAHPIISTFQVENTNHQNANKTDIFCKGCELSFPA